MQPQLEPSLQTRLAHVLMRELIHPCFGVEVDVADLDDTLVDLALLDSDLDDTDDYASYELVYEVAPANDFTPTIEFVRVRDTTHDHVTTIKFPREALDPDTVRFARDSTPYERIDIQHGPIDAPEDVDVAALEWFPEPDLIVEIA